jgi:3-phenylpropionate/cinnamic acid dioxygenase small subunit
MADRAKIADLWGDYGAGNDQRDFDLLESCFTEDASFTVHIAGGDTVGPLQPRKDVTEFFRAALGAQTDRRRHVLTNFRYLEEGADRAQVAAYLSLIVTDLQGATVTKSAGVYDTEVVLDQGSWRFRSVVLDLDAPF